MRDIIYPTIMITLAVIGAAFTYLFLDTYKTRSKERYKDKVLFYEKMDTILSMLHEIFLARTSLENQFVEYAIRNKIDETASSPQDYKKEAYTYLGVCVSRLKQIMDVLTGDNCSVSIKLLIKNPAEDASEPHVVTFLRDAQSQHERGKTDDALPSYPFTGHSPFKDLLLNTMGKEIFIGNNLRLLKKKGEYENINQDWYKYYNATAIAPIKNPNYKTNDDVLGFLCVDNWDGNMHQKVTHGILKIMAGSIYYAMRTVAFFDIMREGEATAGQTANKSNSA